MALDKVQWIVASLTARSSADRLLAELRLRDERVQSLEELLAEIRRGGDLGPHFHEYHTEIINGGDNTSNDEIKKMLADISAQLQRTSQDRDKLMDDVMALQEELALERVRVSSIGGLLLDRFAFSSDVCCGCLQSSQKQQSCRPGGVCGRW
jgi:hypothetical protein